MVQTRTEVVSLFIVEEQEIYREIYQQLLPEHSSIDIVGVLDSVELRSIRDSIDSLKPDVMMLSIKRLDTDLINELKGMRNAHPQMGIVILINHYSSQDIDLLRSLALTGDSGMAIFFKHSLDKIDHLCQMINAVNQGQVILDPPLASFMFAGIPENSFLKQLTTREFEILDMLSQGCTNSAIANALFIDIKTVEHHLNSVYSKLKEDPDYKTKHLRVSAARLYLETMGTFNTREATKLGMAAR